MDRAQLEELIRLAGGDTVQRPPPRRSGGASATPGASSPGPPSHHIPDGDDGDDGATADVCGSGAAGASGPGASATTSQGGEAWPPLLAGMTAVVLVNDGKMIAEEVDAITERWGAPPVLHNWALNCVSVASLPECLAG